MVVRHGLSSSWNGYHGGLPAAGMGGLVCELNWSARNIAHQGRCMVGRTLGNAPQKLWRQCKHWRPGHLLAEGVGTRPRFTPNGSRDLTGPIVLTYWCFVKAQERHTFEPLTHGRFVFIFICSPAFPSLFARFHSTRKFWYRVLAYHLGQIMRSCVRQSFSCFILISFIHNWKFKLWKKIPRCHLTPFHLASTAFWGVARSTPHILYIDISKLIRLLRSVSTVSLLVLLVFYRVPFVLRLRSYIVLSYK